jgi:hypothetical protein
MAQSIAAPMFRKVIFPAKIVKQPPLLNGPFGNAICRLKHLRLLMKFGGVAGRRRRFGFRSKVVENRRF